MIHAAPEFHAQEFHAVVIGGGTGFKKNRQKLTHIKR